MVVYSKRYTNFIAKYNCDFFSLKNKHFEKFSKKSHFRNLLNIHFSLEHLIRFFINLFLFLLVSTLSTFLRHEHTRDMYSYLNPSHHNTQRHFLSNWVGLMFTLVVCFSHSIADICQHVFFQHYSRNQTR